MTEESKPAPGGTFQADYELIRELGKGAMGSVWLARQARLKREVAIKFVRGAGEMISRMEREAKILAELSHPNLVAIYDSGLDNETAFIVLEFVDGESLEARLDRDKKLPEARAYAIAEQMLKALVYIHERGVLHRDLKPGNILMVADGTAKLSDFGLARWSEKDATFQTREGMVPGTPAYMSPELLLTGKAGPQSDLWALSVTLFRMISGESPFNALDLHSMMGQILNKDPFEDPRFEASFAPSMREFLQMALSKEAANRPKDASVYQMALKRARMRTGSSGVRAQAARPLSSGKIARPATPTGPIAASPEPPRSRAVPVLAGLAALIAAAAAGGLALRAPAPVTVPVPRARPPAAVAAAALPAVSIVADTIVRDTSAAVRFESGAPGRYELAWGVAPDRLTSAVEDEAAQTRHILRMKSLQAGKQYHWAVRLPGMPQSPLATGELTTMTETPYWERQSFKPRPGLLSALGKNPQGFEEFRNELDGTATILVPGTEFTMGDRDGLAHERCRPAHKVRVDSFLLDKLPITRKQYKRYMDEANYSAINLIGVEWTVWDDHPMVFVSWHNAADYCRWSGKRLPTEAEWELASGGKQGQTFPWGEAAPERRQMADWGGDNEEGIPLPVGSFPRFAGPYGHLDLVGSVRSWCADWVDEGYYGHSPYRNPQGPPASFELKRACRGCSYFAGNVRDLEIWSRYVKLTIFNSNRQTGFRGARDI
ncbi:MAG: SUMF1/EgtB/PvdO family nonheme iron enzyme [Candidatus Wallbacteria bacterium]|nr:SUMF1/EgtB/PvdO family nonheme iron enzyme [Candidatus Wallbacteria bacterium]